MKLLCPKCSSECEVAEHEQQSLTCPSCGLALFISTSVRGRISSTRVGKLSDFPVAGNRAGAPVVVDRQSLSQQTQTFVGEALTKAPELTLVPQFLGRYEVIDFLGSGAFSRVYLAKDPELDRLVAIKVPRAEKFDSAENLAIFFKEARTIAGLDHPGIVGVYDVGNDGRGMQFIVMQYVQGMTLHQRMAAGRMSYWETAEFVCRVAEAIHIAHKRQVFHRDLKPANILIDTDGRPHVADFGLAVLEHQQQQHVGEVAGTLLYMAPEQIRGEAQWLDGRSDIWSLGAIFYSLLTGRHPFLGAGPKVSDEILNREPRPPRQIDERIPKELERICLKCLTKPVRERYFSAFDLAEDLKTWLQTESQTVAPASSSFGQQATLLPVASSVQSTLATRIKWIALCIAGTAVVAMAAVAASNLSKRELPHPLNPGNLNRPAVENDAKKPAKELFPQKTPFELDSYAVPGVWNPLLETKPREFSLATWDAMRWTHDPRRQELLLDVPSYAYLELGQTDSTKFTFEATIASTNWRGEVGLFWGLKEAPYQPFANAIRPQCHLVHLFCYQDDGKPVATIRRELSQFNRKPDDTLVSNSKTAMSEQATPFPKRRPIKLELQISGKSLHVYLDSQLMQDLAAPSLPTNFASLTPNGRIGVYATNGVFQISDTRIRLAESVSRIKEQK